jgi:carboxymethylenebutenolidase
MDAFGLRPRLEQMAGRIAERGYAVLVPNLLYRAGRAPQFDLDGLADPDRRGAIFQQIFPAIMALGPDEIARDAQAYLDFLAAQDGVDPGPVAATGYCMGGTNALRAVEAHPGRITAVAAFHAGRLVTDKPDSPHLRVGSITGELYFGHADNDGSNSAEQIATLEKALTEAGVTYTSEVYEGAPHGYTMSDTAMYSEPAEQRHWTNLFALLDRAHPARQGA